MAKENLIGKYVGTKKITDVVQTSEEGANRINILKVTFKDETVQQFSELMLDKIVTDRSIDPSQLRELRVTPIVAIVLQVLRDWGIKMSELPYFSTVLNQSISYNHQQAMNELLGQWMPKPLDPDEVDLITVDSILATVKKLTNDQQQK